MGAHELWCWEIDSTDEIDDESQLVYVWCETHKKYEWHNLPIAWQRTTKIHTTDKAPVKM